MWVKSFWQSETERLNIWFFSGFSFDNLLHRNCLACQISTEAIRLTAWGRRGLVCCCYWSNFELWSCLIVAYCSFFWNENFFMALKREMKQEIKNLRFFPPSFPPVLFIHSWCLQTVVVPRFYSPRTQVTGIHIFNSFKWSENWFFFCRELSHIFWKWNGLFSQLDGNMTVILWKKIINASNFQTFQK